MRRHSRRRASALALTVSGVLLAAGCAGATGGGSSDGERVTAPGPEVLDQAEGVTTVTFWHSMGGGALGDALAALTDRFNEENEGSIRVELVYKNSYDDALTAYKAAISSNQTPSLIQVYDIGSQFMIDSGQTIPVQEFADADGVDFDDLQPNIAGYYSIDDTLYSMPFNTSMPLMYFNVDAFEEAGLDPDNPPRTLADIREAAEALTETDAAGNTTRYGFGAAIYGWFLEQWTAGAGLDMCDGANGREERASEVLIDQDTQVELLQWWKQMIDDGLALNTGRETSAAQDAFTAGRTAITLESTGSLGDFLAGAEGRFEVDTAFYPKVSSEDAGGPIIGGASLWISGPGHEPAEQRAAWEYVKFLSTADNQAEWHTSTGYFPTNRAALETDLDREWRAENPQFDTAVDQLEATELTTATQGCLAGAMPKVRQLAEEAIEAALTGAKSVEDALGDAREALRGEMSAYTDSIGG
ncbi:ABC transporter substrate-binding protein [Actinoalloteichus spitiensis]|uniref:ABC transporter substrate-binding protein n=1 Tax=Actinoalloteichus spitiensis TaxID=252394 RepID=UPI00047446F3|nr:ABC transporter substrate-binding protein [Actinoalloteichus spitiensis]